MTMSSSVNWRGRAKLRVAFDRISIARNWLHSLASVAQPGIVHFPEPASTRVVIVASRGSARQGVRLRAAACLGVTWGIAIANVFEPTSPVLSVFLPLTMAHAILAQGIC